MNKEPLFGPDTYRLAYEIQDASNIYAVIGRLSDLADYGVGGGPVIGNDRFENDPAVICLIHKLQSMVGREPLSPESLDALNRCAEWGGVYDDGSDIR